MNDDDDVPDIESFAALHADLHRVSAMPRITGYCVRCGWPVAAAGCTLTEDEDRAVAHALPTRCADGCVPASKSVARRRALTRPTP